MRIATEISNNQQYARFRQSFSMRQLRNIITIIIKHLYPQISNNK